MGGGTYCRGAAVVCLPLAPEHRVQQSLRLFPGSVHMITPILLKIAKVTNSSLAQ